jgi:hypothetical protein
MNERIEAELGLLRHHFRVVEYRDADRWVLIPKYRAPEGIWSVSDPDICFQIPPAYPGQKPYAFYVRLPFALRTGGQINNATPSQEPPLEGDWLKFSWDPPDWRPTSDLRSGHNLLNWALSFRQRLEEGA